MKTLTLINRFQGNSTIVENDFIDHYMTKANGEYVKIYLLLLRHLNWSDCSLTISKLADWLDCTEKDIIRALKYWAEVGLLKIDYDEAGTICGLAIGKSVTPEPQEQPGTSQAPIVEAKPEPDKKPRALSSKEQEELQQVLFVTEQYMGRPLSISEVQKIHYFYGVLNFSTDLIEYLIEYCVENNHRSMHYIESVAIAWAENGITTVSQARENSSFYNKNCFSILNVFGIKGRNPAPFELEYIKKWINEYGFTLDIILEACNRTIANTHKPDFKYTDSILYNWLSNGVHHFPDIARLDLAYQQNKEAKKRNASKPAQSNNRFNNFEGRSYDMDSLEAQLLNTN